MTRDEAVAQIQQLMVFRTDRANEIRNWLRMAQDEFERDEELPWFLLSERSRITTTVGEERVALPNDFLIEDEDSDLLYQPTDQDGNDEGTPITLYKDDEDWAREEYPESGPPLKYSLGKYLRVFPTPDLAYKLLLTYYQRDTKLVSNIENRWLKYAPNMLIGRAGLYAATALSDADRVGIFTALEVEESKRIMKRSAHREQVNRRYQMGGQV